MPLHDLTVNEQCRNDIQRHKHTTRRKLVWVWRAYVKVSIATTLILILSIDVQQEIVVALRARRQRHVHGLAWQHLLRLQPLS